jgi:hypothetical protein
MTFLRRFLASLLGLTAVVFLVFGTVNPFGWFWGRRFLTTIPITRIQKQILLDAWQRKAPVQGLVLGSSQSMKLHPDSLTRRSGLRYFNFAVSAGRLEDDYALLDYTAERGIPTKEIILGVDPWMLGPGALAPELLNNWELEPRVLDRRPTLLWKIGHGARLVHQALTLSYAREVLVSIQATRGHWTPLHTLFDNGYLEYQGRDRQRAAGTYPFKALLRQCLTDIREQTPAASHIDSTEVGYLARTLDRARGLGIAVIVWIPPRHPSLYAMLDSVPEYHRWLAQAVDTIRRVAKAHGARFVDLSSVDKFGGDTLDWYDCIHYGAGNAARVTDRLLEGHAPGAGPPR